MIGGDERQKYAAKKLEDLNYEVLNAENLLLSNLPCHRKEKDFTETIGNSDVIVLPLPVTCDGETIKIREGCSVNIQQLTELLCENHIVFGGMISRELMSNISLKCRKVVDYYSLEEVVIENTIPTAQGVLKIVLDNITKTVPESSVLITGYGKTAKPLARWFALLGSDTCVVARKTSSRAEIGANGAKAIDFTMLSDSINAFDVVINTVPSLVLSDEVLANVKPGAFIVDIASYPYGTDLEAAEKHGVKVIVPGSLPGKSAPETAGCIIARAIHDYLRGDSGG